MNTENTWALLGQQVLTICYVFFFFPLPLAIYVSLLNHLQISYREETMAFKKHLHGFSVEHWITEKLKEKEDVLTARFLHRNVSHCRHTCYG